MRTYKLNQRTPVEATPGALEGPNGERLDSEPPSPAIVASSRQKPLRMRSPEPDRDASIRALWKQAWADVYNLLAPPLTIKDLVVARPIYSQYGQEQFRALVISYLRLPDPWLRQKGFPLCLLGRNIGAIMLSTKRTTPTDYDLPELPED